MGFSAKPLNRYPANAGTHSYSRELNNGPSGSNGRHSHPKGPRIPVMPFPDDEQIRRRAHELWEEAGRPEGRELEFWHRAERELQGASERGDPEKGTPDAI